jgi:hypothetical protein
MAPGPIVERQAGGVNARPLALPAACQPKFWLVDPIGDYLANLALNAESYPAEPDPPFVLPLRGARQNAPDTFVEQGTV